MVKLKICGIKRIEDINIVNRYKIDYVGFVFAKSSRQISFNKAKKLSSSNWRVPTIEEFEELWKYCNYKWTTRNGVEGSLFTSKINGYSIFLPAGGLRYDSDMYSVGCSGNYWSSSTYLRYYAYYMKFYGDHAQKGNITLYYGFSVRLVQDVK